jgi:hypothetical protein
MSFKLAIAASAAALALAAAGAANATIVNISATSGQPTQLVLAAGQYTVEWIGIADGGAYDAWNGACPTGTCTSGWRDAFSVGIVGDPTHLNTYAQPGAPGNSPTAVLTYFKNALTVTEINLTQIGGVFQQTGSQLVPNPILANPDQQVTVNFFAGDGSTADNFGGVSLRITAVPEPAVWTSLIVGFGLVGAAMRRRRLAFAA